MLRQGSEETLVDSAHLLAEFATPVLVPRAGDPQGFTKAVQNYRQRTLDAQIFSRRKTEPGFIVYVTDARGKVVFHTDRDEIGRDYSDWIDVSRTLDGDYGARTTRSDPDDPLSSAMFVAAPVRYNGDRVGVLTVGQPNRSIQPFLETARGQVLRFGTLILLAALVLGAVISIWLTRSIRQLVHYVERVRAGENAQPPRPNEPELARLAQSTEKMRREIEGKQYVERYVHNLAHEMKSPLSAVRGAIEILQDTNPPEDDRRRFLGNIDHESRRMQRLIDRLLSLATLENRHVLEQAESLDLVRLVEEEMTARESAFEKKGIEPLFAMPEQPPSVYGEGLLLRQAIGNLLDNALAFCPEGGRIRIRISPQGDDIALTIHNDGPGIPDYALPRLFERFYSLNQPETGRKSTGLGLSFVHEIAELHGGGIGIENTDTGVCATLRLPAE